MNLNGSAHSGLYKKMSKLCSKGIGPLTLDKDTTTCSIKALPRVPPPFSPPLISGTTYELWAMY